MPLDALPVPLQDRAKLRPFRVAHGSRQPQPVGLVPRQHMGLLVPPGLQAVLHQSQKAVAIGQLLDHIFGQQTLFSQQGEDSALMNIQRYIMVGFNGAKRFTDML